MTQSPKINKLILFSLVYLYSLEKASLYYVRISNTLTQCIQGKCYSFLDKRKCISIFQGKEFFFISFYT